MSTIPTLSAIYNGIKDSIELDEKGNVSYKQLTKLISDKFKITLSNDQTWKLVNHHSKQVTTVVDDL